MKKSFIFQFNFMMRVLMISVILFVFLSSVTAREVIPFNDNWKFILGDAPSYSQFGFDDSGWRTLSVPHDWSIEGRYDTSNPSGPQGGYMPCGIGWYRKTFTLPETTNGNRFFIRFDGVYMKSQVWINDRMVGEYPNGYVTFEYDITPFVKPGEKNVLAVKVDNSLQPGSRWYTGSGIYRDVNLIITAQMHFAADVTFVTTPEISSEKAVVQADYEIINHAYSETVFSWTDNTSLFIWVTDRNEKKQSENRVSKSCTLTSILYDHTGKEVAQHVSIHDIGDFTKNRFRHTLSVDHPRLWSSSFPALYLLKSSIAYDGHVVDEQQTTVGIRAIRYSAAEGMTVNGKPEKLKGIALHQTAGSFGSAVPKDVWKQRLISLKEMGCNALRPCPYPFAPYFYDLCDSLGFYVTDEIFDEWNRGQDWGYSETPYGKMAYSYFLYFDQWYKTDLTRMIRCNRNHPSVIIHLVGNEIPNQRIDGLDIARELIEISKKEDPTRPLTAACDFFVGANIYGFMDMFELAGYNYIDRIHKDSLYLAEHVRYPERVLLGTETYHHTKNHVSVRDNKSVIGEFVWVGFDYLGEIVWHGYRGWSEGIFDIAGSPKPEYYLRKSYWSEEPVVHAAVDIPDKRNFDWAYRLVADHWNWKKDSLLTVCVYTNCDEAALVLNGKNIGKKKVHPDKYCAEWQIPFKAGNIEALGYRKGKIVATHTLNTAGKPAKLTVGNRFVGSKVTRIEALAVDTKGVCIPGFNGKVHVEAVNTQMIGIDNGNPYDPAGEKYTSTTDGYMYDGKIVLYTENFIPGKSSVTLTVEGIEPVIIQ